MTTTSSAGASEAKRVGKFGIVGLLNTALDFGIYNVLFGLFGVDIRIANLISTTCSMIFSFFANKQVVFQHSRGSFFKQAVLFYVVTAFGLYVLQTGTIHILIDVWKEPLQLVVRGVHAGGLHRYLSDKFVIDNGAKAIGTVFSLTWNYFAYKKVVFR